ncbi:hypothetical protein B0H11DRAFT_2323162 [Mycena galericulata]|nr:hypothetical protein B0H11DRAFT_2323162 [Mycena galericulata]
MSEPERPVSPSPTVSNPDAVDQKGSGNDPSYNDIIVDWEGPDDLSNPKILAIGPFLLDPLSEIFGRNRVIQGANLWYLVWNLGCGFAQNTGQLLAFWFLAGLGGSAPLAIGGGVLGDIWDAEQRGQAIAIYSLAPLLGPVVGPLCGAFVAEKSTWRWVVRMPNNSNEASAYFRQFWATTIVAAGNQTLGVVYLRECLPAFHSVDSTLTTVTAYAPFLLEQEANHIRQSLNAEKDPVRHVRSQFANEDRESNFSSSRYLSCSKGRMYLKDKNGGVGQPEYRLPSMVPGTIFLPMGLLITGWGAQAKVHWIVPDILPDCRDQGVALVGAGIILNFQAIQIYLVDAFTLYAASALAATSFLRSLCGFGFPLFAETMYTKLGYGKGDTILAVFAVVLGCPSPWLFWKFGRQIRMRSKFAKRVAS